MSVNSVLWGAGGAHTCISDSCKGCTPHPSSNFLFKKLDQYCVTVLEVVPLLDEAVTLPFQFTPRELLTLLLFHPAALAVLSLGLIFFRPPTVSGGIVKWKQDGQRAPGLRGVSFRSCNVLNLK